MRSIFWKTVGLGRVVLGRSACRNQGGVGKLHFWVNFEKVQDRKWRWRTLDILSDRFWNYFSQFQGNCKENGCGLGFLRILFLYRIQPLFFQLEWPYFSTCPYFSTWVALGFVPIFLVAEAKEVLKRFSRGATLRSDRTWFCGEGWHRNMNRIKCRVTVHISRLKNGEMTRR